MSFSIRGPSPGIFSVFIVLLSFNRKLTLARKPTDRLLDLLHDYTHKPSAQNIVHHAHITPTGIAER